MKQIVGYLIGLAGIVVLGLSFESIKKASGLTLPASVTSTVLTAAGLIIIGVSLILLFKSSDGHQVSEVPIYKGKDIVGFRRVGK